MKHMRSKGSKGVERLCHKVPPWEYFASHEIIGITWVRRVEEGIATPRSVGDRGNLQQFPVRVGLALN